MPCWILCQALDLPRLWVVLPLTHYSRPKSPLRKNACSSLITMTDADLEGVVVEPSDQCACTALVLLLENLKQRVAVCQTLFWSVHHSVRIPNCVVEKLDLTAVSVAR